MPTADQAAKIIVLACREMRVNPLDIDKRHRGGKSYKAQRMRMAKAYAALAMRDVFKGVTSGAIGRMVCALEPKTYLAKILTARAKGRLIDYDPEVLARIVQGAGIEVVAVEQKIVDETVRASDFVDVHVGGTDSTPFPKGAEKVLIVKKSDAPAPRPGTRKSFDSRYRSSQFGSRARLEDELRQAVLNTGGRIEE